MILSPLGVDIVTKALFATHPVMVLPSASGSSSSASLRGSRRMASTCVKSRLESMITSSWPRSAWPSFGESALGETRMVSPFTSVPRWAWAMAKEAEKRKTARKMASSQNVNSQGSEGIPPPPWSIAVIGLRELRRKILVLEQLRGKILRTKELTSLWGARAMNCICNIQDQWFADRSQGHLNDMRDVKSLNHEGHEGPRRKLSAELLQHRGLDVAARDDGYVHLCLWQLIVAKEESGDGDRAAGFGNRLWILGQQFHGLSNFVFGNGNDVVDIGADMLEVDGADALRAEAVGERAGDLLSGELNDLSGAKAGVRVGGEFGFNADHFDLGICELDRRGDAADEGSATDGGEDGFDFG